MEMQPQVQHPLARTLEEWAALMAEWDEPRFRAQQIFRWLHVQGECDATKMTNLSPRLRDKLVADGLNWPAIIAHSSQSQDGTQKLLLRLEDGKEIETVLLPRYVDDEEEEGEEDGASYRPVTQCVSSQVGCAMGCVFCASGVAGLKRHMTAGEIIAQPILGRKRLPEDQPLRRLVFMGMGEPLHNYDALSRALTLITHPEGLAFPARRVTVSTSGLVPEIDRLAKDFRGDIRLAVSLHASDDEQRSSLMPVNRKYPIAELRACLERFPVSRRSHITIEYTLIKNTNDSINDARQLARLLKRLRVKINLIPMNPVQGTPLEAPRMETVQEFQSTLRDLGFLVYVRRQRGEVIDAACGQLALAGEERRRRLPRVDTPRL